MKQLELLIAYSHQAPHSTQQPATVQQVGPDGQFCPGQNTLQNVNDISCVFVKKKNVFLNNAKQ